MDDQTVLARIRVNGQDPQNADLSPSAEARALGRAERLANVGQLAAGLAHEMNTPLGSISAHAEESLELLEQLPCAKLTPEKVEELRERLLAIMRQSHRCSRIATRLLQFAQPSRPLSVKCRVEQVISDVVELFSPAAQEVGVNLTRQLGPELPEAPVAPADLEQLLVNLLQRLPRFVGKAKAMEMVLTGRMMDAAEAERCGLVSRIVPADQLIDEAVKTAQKIAEMSLPSVMLAKESVNRAFETTLNGGVRFERRMFHSLFATEDQKEGMAAFAEKRKPAFKNR